MLNLLRLQFDFRFISNKCKWNLWSLNTAPTAEISHIYRLNRNQTALVCGGLIVKVSVMIEKVVMVLAIGNSIHDESGRVSKWWWLW